MTLSVDIKRLSKNWPLETKFKVQPNQPTVLVGPNGAGKTSLMKCIAGIEKVESGTIQWNDQIWNSDESNSFIPPQNRNIGVVFQSPELFSPLSVLENVAFPLRARGFSKSEAHNKARHLLHELHIDHLSHRFPHQLSGGESQKTALCRALIAQPQLLLLDEPFSATDAQAKVELMDLFFKALKGFNGCLLWITHDPTEAFKIAQQIVVIEKGKQIQKGSPEDIRKHPLSPFVASFVGFNYWIGKYQTEDHLGFITVQKEKIYFPPLERNSDQEILITLSPKAVTLNSNPPEGSARNVFQGKIDSIEETQGSFTISFQMPFPLSAVITESALRDMKLSVGKDVWVSWKASEIHVMG